MTTDTKPDAHPFTLSKVNPYLRRWFKVELAPRVVTVRFNGIRAVYLKQRDGYIGVLISAETGMRLPIAHYVGMCGDNAGWVTPSTITNRIAGIEFEKGDSIISAEEYQSVLRRVLMTLTDAYTRHAKNPAKETHDVPKLINLPPWISIREGMQTEQDVHAAQIAGVPQFLVEYCEVSGQVLDVDARAYLENRVNPNFIEIVEGEWDDAAERQGRHIFLKSGEKELAVKSGLKLVSRRDNSKPWWARETTPAVAP